jgi:hypothetical protein
MTKSTRSAAADARPEFTASDAVDHLAITRDVCEGVYLASHGLADPDERDAIAALVLHLGERIEFVADRLRDLHEGAKS